MILKYEENDPASRQGYRDSLFPDGKRGNQRVTCESKPRSERRRESGLLMIFDKANGVADSANLLGVFVLDLSAELLLERHDDFDQIE